MEKVSKLKYIKIETMQNETQRKRIENNCTEHQEAVGQL